MFFFISKRLPFGLRAGFSVPIGQPFQQATRRSGTSLGMAGMQFVYVILGDHGLVKIGTTSNMDARIAALRTSSPFQLKPVYALAVDIDARMIEQEVHRRLDKHRCAGEWFDCSPAIAEQAINQVAGDFGIATAITDNQSLQHTLNTGAPLNLQARGQPQIQGAVARESNEGGHIAAWLFFIAALAGCIWLVNHFG